MRQEDLTHLQSQVCGCESLLYRRCSLVPAVTGRSTGIQCTHIAVHAMYARSESGRYPGNSLTAYLSSLVDALIAALSAGRLYTRHSARLTPSSQFPDMPTSSTTFSRTCPCHPLVRCLCQYSHSPMSSANRSSCHYSVAAEASSCNTLRITKAR